MQILSLTHVKFLAIAALTDIAFNKFYGHHHELVDHYKCMTDIFVIQPVCFPLPYKNNIPVSTQITCDNGVKSCMIYWIRNAFLLMFFLNLITNECSFCNVAVY